MGNPYLHSPQLLTAMLGLAFLIGCYSPTPTRPARTDASGDGSDSLRAQDVKTVDDALRDRDSRVLPDDVKASANDSPIVSDLGSASAPDLSPSRPEAAPDSPTADIAVGMAPDAAPFLNTDLGQDTTSIRGFDTSPSPGLDTGPDLRPDSPPDLRPDSPPDLRPDSPPDFRPDSPPDFSPDTPVLKPRGSICQDGRECADGVCVGHICCNRECSGECEECTTATNGECSFKTGTLCRAATGCMNAASCSGTSASCPSSTPKPSGTPCGTITCSGSTQSGPTCNDSGACGASTNKECYPFACTNGTGCKTACEVNADCVSDPSTFCGANGACVVNSQCWHSTDGTSAASLLWQVNPKEPNDPVGGPYDPAYHNYSEPGNTPDDVCKALTLCGFNDWKVPTISELRTLIRGCPNTMTGGTCGVSDTCLGATCDLECAACDFLLGSGTEGCYWPSGISGPCSMYWSSSAYFDADRQKYRYRQAGFSNGTLGPCDPEDSGFVRCVRHSP